MDHSFRSTSDDRLGYSRLCLHEAKALEGNAQTFHDLEPHSKAVQVTILVISSNVQNR